MYVYDRAGVTHTLVISITLNNIRGQNKKTEAITSVFCIRHGGLGNIYCSLWRFCTMPLSRFRLIKFSLFNIT